MIHMDINKCIIIQDPVKGFSIDDSLNSILSEVVWGEIDASLPDDEVDRWRLISAEPSVVPPSATAISYSSFLETRTNLQRAARRPLIRGFTKKGGKGEACIDAFQRLKRAMTIPGINYGDGHNKKKRKLEELRTVSEATRRVLGNQGLIAYTIHLILDFSNSSTTYHVIFLRSLPHSAFFLQTAEGATSS